VKKVKGKKEDKGVESRISNKECPISKFPFVPWRLRGPKPHLKKQRQFAFFSGDEANVAKLGQMGLFGGIFREKKVA
jgi:hypothetical protein